MAKELVINKDTKLDKIENKEEYTKLVIKNKFNPKKLSGFTNIKELVIDGLDMKNNIYYKYINLPAIANNVEKIKFINLTRYGKCKQNIISDVEYYRLNYYNLKSIEFPSFIQYIGSDYLMETKNLEEIIFNIPINSYELIFDNFIISSTKLKRIIIKYMDKEYVINLDYAINIIKSIKHVEGESGNIEVSFSNNEVVSDVKINTKMNKIKYNNYLENPTLDNGILYIPDYITDINEERIHDIREISLNLKLLDNIKRNSFTLIRDYKNMELEKIILRNSNSMCLIPERVINVKDYGEFVCAAIEDNILKILYYNYMIKVNSSGMVKEIGYNKKLDKPQKQEVDLNKLNDRELKTYLYCKFLLEQVKEYDIEYKKAMEVVEDRVIKKLKKLN